MQREGYPEDPRAAAAQIHHELQIVRHTFRADWAVVWGPVPLDVRSPFAHVLFEDRDPNNKSMLGLAVPVVGNPWLQEILTEGGAISHDAPQDVRLRLHHQVIQHYRILSIASGANQHQEQAWGLVEVYARNALTLPREPVALLQTTARRIAVIMERLRPPCARIHPTSANDSMMAAVLHDLKNALAAQSLLVTELERQLQTLSLPHDPSRQASVLESIAVLKESVLHAGELVKLLSLGNVTRSSQTTLDFAGLIRLALASVPPELRQRFTVTIDPKLTTTAIVPDTPALLRVMVNLVQNAASAIQHIPEARAFVRSHPEGEDVLIEVEDHGPGVAPEVLEHLFEPGVTTRGAPEEHGYGLYSSRTTVESMGGTLAVYSIPGQLARFIVRLPRNQVGM